MAERAGIRVVALIESYRPAGPARNLIEFARAAREAKGDLPAVDLSIVTFQRGALEPPNAFVTAAREASLAVDVLAERFRFDPAVIPQLRAVIARRRPDIVQSHNVKSHLLVRLTGLSRQLPWVAFHHGYTATNLKDRVYNQFDRWSLRAASRALTVCRPFAAQLERRGVARERIRIQHNPLRPFTLATREEAEALRVRLGIPAGVPVILSVGRLSREKGCHDLLEALGRLHRRTPAAEFRLVIVGDGPEAGRLRRQAQSLGLAGRVVLAGFQNDVRPYYAMADLLVLPSHSEGSPNVLLEAMSAGVPVVATAVGGVPEIAEHEHSALLVKRGDREAIRAAIERLLGDAELRRRLAAAAREVVATRHSPETYRRAVIEVYQSALDERARTRASGG
jgi:glycosyltransferase involved in cell wall biosynthesis